MVFAYNIFIILYGLGIKIACLFSHKARAWVKGRIGWKEKIESALSSNKNKIIWMHSASLGEFEQGRTLIDSIRKDYPTYKMLVTFFSPSGYEVRKNYTGVDFVFYLPLDTKKNAEQFIELIQPSLVVFIKYELWFHYLHTLHKKEFLRFLYLQSFYHPKHILACLENFSNKCFNFLLMYLCKMKIHNYS